MRTGRTWKTLAVLMVLIGLVVVAGPARANDHGRKLWYLAVGDSLSVGVQPDEDGINHPTTNGYADQLYQQLKATTPHLELKKLGCAVTETSEDMLKGRSDCRSQYKLRVQLADAVAFLLLHRGSVKLVTIDIGANDLEICAGPTGINPTCVEDAFGDVAANLPKILKALRLAAGPDVPIVGMNYYNPFLAAWLDPTLGPPFVEVANGILANFNGLLGSIYGFYRMPVADVATAFGTTDDQLVPAPPPFPPMVPQNVLNICFLTYMCPGGNIHATTDGYGVITQAFLDVLP
jgi:lysophospholipase L1-like esterase